MSSFVLPVRKGGLGNQLFQVAAAMVYGRETNRRIILPNEFYNNHKTVQGDYAESIFREFIHRLEKPIDGMAIQHLVQQGFTLYPGEPGFEPWGILDVSGNILLHGYFQYYPPIGKHEEFIRTTYLNGLQNLRKMDSENHRRVGIHIRRGDYLVPPHNELLPTQPLSYYQTALSYFDSLSTEFVIFSDDIEWCKQQKLFQELPKKVFVEEKNEIKTLALMSCCFRGFICANSTFSWWGAFLGAYSLRNTVIVPHHWINVPIVELFPSEWIQI